MAKGRLWATEGLAAAHGWPGRGTLYMKGAVLRIWCLLVLTSAHKGDIQTMTAANHDEVLAGSKFVLVNFFAPWWCVVCSKCIVHVESC